MTLPGSDSDPACTGSPGDRLSARAMAAITADFSRHVNRGQVRYLRAGRLDVLETERSGVTFTDPVSGRRLYDCFSSAGSFNVGRHNPAVLAALEAAAGTLDLGIHELASPWKAALSARLAEIAPGDLNRVVLAAGGGEAIDAAIKLARGATGRPGIVSTVKAYHGHTGFALSANGKKHYRHYCEPLMGGFSFVPFNDLGAVAGRLDRDTAAVIVEPVQGEAGIFVGTDDYLVGLREACDRNGSLLIFDEIQTGFGRTGRLFACEHSGVVPDIMTVAKSLGGGVFPSAAMLFRDTPLLAGFADAHPGFHESYAGGSDIACAVSLAVLDEIVGNRLWENAARMGSRLAAALEELRARHPGVIREVRGRGLMLGIEYLHEFMGPMMSEALARHGLFAAYSGNAPQVMRFMVPLTVTEDEMDGIVAAVGAAVLDMQRLLPLALPAARIPGVLRLLNDERVQTFAFGLLRSLEEVAGRLARGGRR